MHPVKPGLPLTHIPCCPTLSVPWCRPQCSSVYRRPWAISGSISAQDWDATGIWWVGAQMPLNTLMARMAPSLSYSDHQSRIPLCPFLSVCTHTSLPSLLESPAWPWAGSGMCTWLVPLSGGPCLTGADAQRTVHCE